MAMKAYDISARWGLTPHTALHAAWLLDRLPDLRITSGRRTPRRNRDVGGSPTSWHLYGRGVDFGGPRASERAAVGVAWEQRVSKGCTGPEEVLLEADHVHIAW
uniref:Peptidase M15A C-terminal domain-containing protein n=1 Tax=uncultured prokaryote TaxID=198431 RepID=A0A0H5Q6Z2_9ZZZZ|nr:hypothetical protein [uncultured prokaryote]